MSISPSYVDGLELRIKELGERVEKLTEECVVLRASNRTKLDTIAYLEKQVEKLTKEQDELVNAIDNEMVVTHMGVFNAGDDPKVALNKICCYAQDLGKFFAEDACKGQLAALAEQSDLVRAEENEAIIAAANALENIASTSSSTRIRRVANEALKAIRARRK